MCWWRQSNWTRGWKDFISLILWSKPLSVWWRSSAEHPAGFPHQSTAPAPTGCYLLGLQWRTRTHLYSFLLLSLKITHSEAADDEALSSRLHRREANSQMIFEQKVFNKRWFTRIHKFQAKDVILKECFSNYNHMLTFTSPVQMKSCVYEFERRLMTLEIRYLRKINLLERSDHADYADLSFFPSLPQFFKCLWGSENWGAFWEYSLPTRLTPYLVMLEKVNYKNPWDVRFIQLRFKETPPAPPQNIMKIRSVVLDTDDRQTNGQVPIKTEQEQ